MASSTPATLPTLGHPSSSPHPSLTPHTPISKASCALYPDSKSLPRLLHQGRASLSRLQDRGTSPCATGRVCIRDAGESGGAGIRAQHVVS